MKFHGEIMIFCQWYLTMSDPSLSITWHSHNTTLFQQISSDCPVSSCEMMARSSPVHQATWNLSVIAGVIRNNMTDCNLVSWGSFPSPPPSLPSLSLSLSTPLIPSSAHSIVSDRNDGAYYQSYKSEMTHKYDYLPSWKLLTSPVENIITLLIILQLPWLKVTNNLLWMY